MYLWHVEKLQELPGPLLTALHRDVCRIRSSRWGRVRGKSGWVFMLTWQSLVWYHRKVLSEMHRRGWNPSQSWNGETFSGRRVKVPEMVLSTSDEVSGRDCARVFKKHNPNTPEQDQVRLDSWRIRHGRQ